MKHSFLLLLYAYRHALLKESQLAILSQAENGRNARVQARVFRKWRQYCRHKTGCLNLVNHVTFNILGRAFKSWEELPHAASIRRREEVVQVARMPQNPPGLRYYDQPLQMKAQPKNYPAFFHSHYGKELLKRSFLGFLYNSFQAKK